MSPEDRQKLYDEVVEKDSAVAFLRALYDHCETPEEVLAAKVVDGLAYTPRNKKPTKNYPEFACVRWPWGDAHGVLYAGGRSYWEARLRLRDKLVASARDLVKEAKS